MPTVAALIVDRRERDRLAAVMRPLVAVKFCDRAIEVWRTIEGGDTVAVIADHVDADRRPTAPLVAVLRRTLPSLLIIVRQSSDGDAASLERRAMALISNVVALSDWSDTASVAMVREKIAVAPLQNPRAAMVAAIGKISPPLHPLVDSYLRVVIVQPRWPVRVRDVMDAVDSTKRRTTEHELERAHLPTPEQIVGWVFVLDAAWLSALPGSTFTAIAQHLGFRSASALRLVFKNRTGITPRAAMRGGGFAYLLDRFIALLHGDWSREPIGRWPARPLSATDQGSGQ